MQNEKYLISKQIIKNIHGNYDILIHKPKFSQFNITNVQFLLLDEENLLSDLLDEFEYEIMVHSCSIFKNKLKSKENIFICSEIPFSYNIYHELTMIIYNINPKLKSKLINYYVCFDYTLSQILPQLQIDLQPFQMDWNCGINEILPNENKLLFIGGMLGITRMLNKNLSNINDDFFVNHHRIFAHYNNSDESKYYFGLNINYLDTNNNWVDDIDNEFDQYSCTKLVKIMFEKKYQNDQQDLKYYVMISDTLKRPLSDIMVYGKTNNFYKYKVSMVIYYGGFDGLTNIQFLCDSSKYLLKNVNLLTESIMVPNQIETNIFDLEFDSNFTGYKILGIDNFTIIPTILYQKTSIELEFDILNELDLIDGIIEVDDFFIKYDRVCLDTLPRKRLGQNNKDYIEYPCVDITEYL